MNELKKYYEQGWEVVWAKQLDESGSPKNNIYRNRMLDAINLIEKENKEKFTVLDVGCGIGIYSLNILKKFPNSKVHCFDISKKQVEFAKKLFKKKGLAKRSTFFVSDAENFNLDKKFDIIICTEVLEHLLKPEKALKNIINSAKKNTQLIFSVPYSAKGDREYWVCRQENNGKWLESEDYSKIDKNRGFFKFFHKDFSDKGIKKLLEKSGLKIQKSLYSNAYFGNKWVDLVYSKMSIKELDNFFNLITKNKLASQITVRSKIKS